jgi:hypothetical protein
MPLILEKADSEGGGLWRVHAKDKRLYALIALRKVSGSHILVDLWVVEPAHIMFTDVRFLKGSKVDGLQRSERDFMGHAGPSQRFYKVPYLAPTQTSRSLATSSMKPGTAFHVFPPASPFR